MRIIYLLNYAIFNINISLKGRVIVYNLPIFYVNAILCALQVDGNLFDRLGTIRHDY